VTTLIDATTAEHARGIGTVISGVVHALSLDDEVVIAAAPSLGVPDGLSVTRITFARTRVGRLAYQRFLLPVHGAATGVEKALLLDAYAPVIRPRRIRYAALIHDVLPLTHPQFWGMSKRLVKSVAFATLKHAQATLFASTEHNAREIERLLGREARVAPFGCGQLTDAEADGARHRPLGERDLTVTYVGALEPRKNLFLLIDAFERAARVVPDLRLQLLGSGSDPYERALSARIARSSVRGRVSIQSGLDKPTVLRSIASSGVLVFPSLAEGFGLPILEALALGVPVVASDLPEISAWAGGAIRYASPHEAASWVSPLLDAMAVGADERRKAQDFALQYRWRSTAGALLDF
jgi:glycosyltransferase involved in cell wall biosynthesis